MKKFLYIICLMLFLVLIDYLLADTYKSNNFLSNNYSKSTNPEIIINNNKQIRIDLVYSGFDVFTKKGLLSPYKKSYHEERIEFYISEVNALNLELDLAKLTPKLVYNGETYAMEEVIEIERENKQEHLLTFLFNPDPKVKNGTLLFTYKGQELSLDFTLHHMIHNDIASI